MGHMAHSQIKKSNGQETGDGLAIAGLIIGWLGVAFIAIWVILMIIGAASEGGY